MSLVCCTGAVGGPQNNGIEVTGLVREFKNGPRAVDGIDLDVAPGRDLRLPRPERRRQVDHRPHADHAAAPHRRHREGRRLRHRHASGAGRPRRDRRRPAGGRARPAADRRASTCACRPAMHGLPKAERPPRRRADRAGRPRRRRRPQRRRLLGRHEAPARPGAGAGPRPAGPLPRRAHHRARHPEPHRAVGRGRAPRRATRASPSSSPPSTSRRPTSSPTASGSSTTARSSPRARPTALKAEIGRPTVEAVPADPAGPRARRRSAPSASASRPRPRPARSAVRLSDGVDELAAIVRALDAEGIRIGQLDLHAPSLDDVFLAKTGRSPRGRRRRGRAPRARPASTSAVAAEVRGACGSHPRRQIRELARPLGDARPCASRR